MTVISRIGFIVFFVVTTHSVTAQVLGKVGSLLMADRTAARLSEIQGPHAAWMSVVDRNSTFFTPAPVNALDYLDNRPNIPDVMTWRRSEERRVGKEGVGTCRYRGSPCH